MMTLWSGKQRQLEDHDRVVVLEQRLEWAVTQFRREMDALIAELAASHTRLDDGSRTFQDLRLAHQRIEEALADLRDKTAGARLSADNASRAIETVSRELDRRSEQRDRQRDADQQAVEDAITVAQKALTDMIASTTSAQRVALEQQLLVMRDDVNGLKETLKTWRVQTGLLRMLVSPALAIGLTLLTTLIIRWLFP